MFHYNDAFLGESKIFELILYAYLITKNGQQLANYKKKIERLKTMKLSSFEES